MAQNFFQTTNDMVQTLSLLMSNKFKQCIVLTKKQRFLKQSIWQFILMRQSQVRGDRWQEACWLMQYTIFLTMDSIFCVFARKIKYNYIEMYFKYKI